MQPVNSELAVDRLSFVSFEAALVTRAPAVSNFDYNMARKRVIVPRLLEQGP